MIKLLKLISPRTLLIEAEEKELPEEFQVSERGYEFLKERIAELNKKAAKYKVPPIEIVVVKEEMVKAIHPDLKKMQMSQPIIIPLDKGLLQDPNSWVLVKRYTLTLKGEPPHVEGYEFIARLEHTPEGNFIYTNPKSSVPNLPPEFKSMNQHCDVCKTNRDRHDTFVIRMEKEDPVRFPDKKVGDLLVVGRNCLARFLPGLTAAGLIAWTNMIEASLDDVQEAGEMGDDDGYGGMGGKHYEHPEHLLKYLVATYLHMGKYISRKQAQQNIASAGIDGPNTQSTLQRTLQEMRPPWKTKNPEKDFPIRTRLINDPEFIGKVEKMMKEFEEWLPQKNWDEMIKNKPEFSDFFNNLKLVSKQEYLRGSHFGFYSALLQLFLRDKQDAEKKAETEKAMASLPPSPVVFNETLIGKRLRDVAKEAEIKRLSAGGMDEKAIKKSIRGKEWGWEVLVKKITEYEKTQTFGYGDSGIGYRILFTDTFGNDFMWFASTSLGLQENGKYIIDGTITGHEPPSKYHPLKPQTRINRVKIIKDFQQPETPPQSEPASPPISPTT